MGLFTGRPPKRLGVVDGKLHPVREHAWNAVSSYSASRYHQIAPFSCGQDADAAFEKLARLVRDYPGATVVSTEPGYLYARFKSGVFGFVDDAEFLLDRQAGLIQMRSASRLGRKDFGVNRFRIERLRSQLGAD